MTAGRVDPGEYAALGLRAHELLADVPLHDVWAVDVAAGATVADVHALLAPERLARSIVRSASRRRSREIPGSSRKSRGALPDSHAFPRESLSEVQNATVHAFSVLALDERGGGPRLYWAIHVRPVGPMTRWYLRLIDPFRRLVIYPAVLRHLERGMLRVC